MVFCSKCGNEIKDEDDEFCSRCGMKLKKPKKGDAQVSSKNTNKDWCLKCGKELPFGQGEWPPGFPKICPACGSKVVDQSIATRDSELEGGNRQERIRTSTFPSLPVLIIVFIFSLFWIYASGLSDASYILYAIFGILALYWVYKAGEEERKYVKYIAYFSILFGIFIVLYAITLTTVRDMVLTYGEALFKSYVISFGVSTSRAVEGIRGILIFEGIIVMAFGFLLWMHVRSKDKQFSSNI